MLWVAVVIAVILQYTRLEILDIWLVYAYFTLICQITPKPTIIKKNKKKTSFVLLLSVRFEQNLMLTYGKFGSAMPNPIKDQNKQDIKRGQNKMLKCC